MDELSDNELVDNAHAICSDLTSADSPDDIAFHDQMALVDTLHGVYSDQAGWFTYRATASYCPQFSNLSTFNSYKNAP